MKALKSALWILPLLFTFSAMAGDEFAGSSGKGGKVAEAPKSRAVASAETPEQRALRLVYQCKLVRDTVGSFLYMMVTNINSPTVVAGPWWGTERAAEEACQKVRNKAEYAKMKAECTCGTLAGAQAVPSKEQIAWANPKADKSLLAKD